MSNPILFSMKNLFKVVMLIVAFATLSFITAEKNEINIVIDAGHGGHDLGATHEDILEKSIVGEVTKKIQSLNTDSEVKIYVTRSEDHYLSLQERTNFINEIKPDLVISLHVNQNKNVTTNGFEIFVSDKSDTYQKSDELAQKLISEFEKNIPLKNRGVKKAPFMVLKKSEVPALTLEMGFISNKKDREYITGEEGQNQIAKTILNFVTNLK